MEVHSSDHFLFFILSISELCVIYDYILFSIYFFKLVGCWYGEQGAKYVHGLQKPEHKLKIKSHVQIQIAASNLLHKYNQNTSRQQRHWQTLCSFIWFEV